jgi:hemolysin-activating ACP:hemolysin acyltransferase
VALDQVHLLFDGSGEVIGYFTWAFLSDKSQRRLLSDVGSMLSLHEWLSGPHLWIMDAMAIPGYAKFLKAAVNGLANASGGHINYVRRDVSGRIRKHVEIATEGRWKRSPPISII